MAARRFPRCLNARMSYCQAGLCHRRQAFYAKFREIASTHRCSVSLLAKRVVCVAEICGAARQADDLHVARRATKIQCAISGSTRRMRSGVIGCRVVVRGFGRPLPPDCDLHADGQPVSEQFCDNGISDTAMGSSFEPSAGFRTDAIARPAKRPGTSTLVFASVRDTGNRGAQGAGFTAG